MPCNFDPKQLANHKIFIETGTYTGKTIEKFKDVYEIYHTIEIVKKFHEETKNKFKDQLNIHFHLGHSPVIIKKLLDSINQPVTFWLDAHYQGGDQPRDTTAPIKDELKIIKSHSINTHMIMIDDVRLFSTYRTSVDEIKKILLDINPKYKIEFKPGIKDGDVMVAYVD